VNLIKECQWEIWRFIRDTQDKWNSRNNSRWFWVHL